MLILTKIIKELGTKVEQITEVELKNRRITSVTIIERNAFEDWINGGEFLLISASSFTSEAQHQKEIIEQLIRYRAGALAIKMDVSTELHEETIDLANRFSFPIFSFVASTHYQEIMATINDLLYLDKKSELLKSSLASYFLFNKSFDNEKLDVFSSHLKPIKNVVILSKRSSSSLKSEQKMVAHERYINSLTAYLENLKETGKIYDFTYVKGNQNDLLLLFFTEKMNDEESLSHLSGYLAKEMFTNASEIIWGSSKKLPLEQSNIAYHQAVFAQKFQKLVPPQSKIIEYSRVEFYEIIEQYAKQGVSNQFFAFTQALTEHPILLESLSSYFESDESLLQASAELYVHPNTLRYRLKRIKELTGLDVMKSADKVKLFLGMIYINNIK